MGQVATQIKPPSVNNRPTNRLLVPAANEQGDAGQIAIASMRAALGKNSAASKFDKLTHQQKAIVLIAARLRPSQYINSNLMSLNDDEREAIRQALISLAELSRAFVGVPLGREQFYPTRRSTLVAGSAAHRSEAGPRVNQLDEISSLAAELAGEVQALNQNNEH